MPIIDGISRFANVKNVKLRLTSQQRKNLKKLRDYLWALPENYQHFEMRKYFKHNNLEYFEYDQVADIFENHICGTVACAIGHGPAAGIWTHNLKGLVGGHMWEAYCERAFGANASEGRDKRRLWEFLFSSGWAQIDNTPHGAADRIHYFLEKGVPVIHDDDPWYSGSERAHLWALYDLNPEDRPIQPKVETAA